MLFQILTDDIVNNELDKFLVLRSMLPIVLRMLFNILLFSVTLSVLLPLLIYY